MMPRALVRVQPRSLSEVLGDLQTSPDERISIADLLQIAGDRAFGALLFLFALPNLLPMPPGTSAVLGVPLVLIAAQLAAGRAMPWLPRSVARRSISRAAVTKFLARVAPGLRRLERALKPRLLLLTSPAAERIIGVLILVLAVVVLLPIPLGNVLPAAAICALALALLEHDGLMVIVGVLLALASGLLVVGAVYALVLAATALVRHVTGAA